MSSIDIARRLLRIVLPRLDRDTVVADLDEELQRHVLPRRGPRGAARWYWAQTLSSLPAAVRLRYRAWRRDETMTMQDTEPMVAQIAQDVRYAWRGWRREPIFALTAIATYAVAVAVAAAIASVAYRVLVEPLPYRDGDALVGVREADRGNFSWPDFLALRQSTRSLSDVVGYNGVSRALVNGGMADRLSGVEVTEGFFEALGIQPMAGRLFRPEDFVTEAPLAVMLTHATWQRRFGGDPALAGRTILLDGQPATVAGILPDTFEFPLRGGAEFWQPLRPSRVQRERGYVHWLDVIARRRPGVSDAQIAADLDLLARLRAAEDPKYHASARLSVIPLREEIVGYVRPSLLALLTAVALLFLAACANVAGLVFARTIARRRELSVRAAIGAAPARLARQLVIESLMLTTAGTAIGSIVAGALVRSAMSAVPARQKASLLYADRLDVAPEVVAGVFVLSILAGLTLGIFTSIRTNRADFRCSLTLRGATAGGARWRSVLVAGEVALALMLIAGTGLLARSVYRLLHVSPGFDPRGLLTFRIMLPAPRDAQAALAQAVRDRNEMAAQALRDRIATVTEANRDRVLAAFRALPGVTEVSTIDQLPLTGRSPSMTLQIIARPVAGEEPTVLVRTIGADYFDAMGIPIEAGRPFNDRDRRGTPSVAIVNRMLADRVFGGSAIGQRIAFPSAPGGFDVVGIVGDEQFTDIDSGRDPVVYLPYLQSASGNFSVVLRGSDPAAIGADVRRALARIDPQVPAFAMRTMEEILEESRAVFLRRTVLTLLTVFAISVLVLTTVGIYGTLAYAVTQRRREIGLRMALGAHRAAIARVMLARGMSPVAVGCIAGLLGSLGLAGSLRALLFGVEATDPAILTAAVALLGSVSLLACAVPVWRALRVDPATALRNDGS